LGLGSNLGDRRRRVEAAVERLGAEGVKVRAVSSLYRTAPVGPVAQPWFVNAAVAVEARRTPSEMLALIKKVEAELGRRRRARYGPREVDIDILLAGRTILRSPGLVLPHPRMSGRRFVLVPLAEIAPRAVHPRARKTVRTLLRETGDHSPVIRLK
jgi:2-amino-4-hydroxy-6-hydroxymethyldihydropteridine diphosphokinase